MSNKSLPINPIYDYRGIVTENPNFIEGSKGLTKREYFGVLVLQGLICRDNSDINSEELIQQAFEIADKFLEFLYKEQ